ncbi:MAG: hypothetical protein D3926_05445 [Desulfobacteraceae bacterium]|nr:MAG: hypothetical protein D3926_05445 [Desulfobacteraceae bacterium]
MVQPQMMARILDYQKTVFDTSFSVIASIQDQTNEMMNTVCENATVIPESNKKACTHWTEFFKQNRANFKDYVDTSFNRIKEFFEDPKAADSGPDTAKK